MELFPWISGRVSTATVQARLDARKGGKKDLFGFLDDDSGRKKDLKAPVKSSAKTIKAAKPINFGDEDASDDSDSEVGDTFSGYISFELSTNP